MQRYIMVKPASRHPRWKILLFGALTGLLLTGRMGALALSHLHSRALTPMHSMLPTKTPQN